MSQLNKCHCGIHCVENGEECLCLEESARVPGNLIHGDPSALCLDNSENGTISKDCSCLNGFRVNNTCVCANGYQMVEGLNDLCEPHCPRNCVNGFCKNPYECACMDGYQFGHDSSDPICHPIIASGLKREVETAGTNW